MKNMLLSVSLLALFSLPTASAQERSYVWTIPYGTDDAGEFGIESNSFLFAPSLLDNIYSLEQQFEIEYGVTDRFQLGLYQVFSHDHLFEKFSAKSSMIEAIYNLAGKDEFIIDPMIYLEYERDWNLKNPNQVEFRLILSKDLGRFNTTVNGIAEYEFGGRSKFTPELNAGISYQIASGVRAGVETFATLKGEDEAADEDFSGVGIGPTISVSTPWFEVMSGAAFGISENSNAVNFCTTLGMGL